MITSQKTTDPNSISLVEDDFQWGSLQVAQCYLRPTYTATIDEALLGAPIGALKTTKVNEVLSALRRVLS